MNVIDQKTGFKIDIYPAGSDELNAWGLKNKRRVELIAKEEVWVGSQKHIEDIKGMLEVSGDQIDVPLVGSWISKLGLTDCWEQFLRGS